MSDVAGFWRNRLRNTPFDVVVVGAGGAGTVAALFLGATRGLKVLLVEHTKHVGGTTALSAGSAWIPNTLHAANVSPPDSVERAATYLRHAVGNLSSEEMRRAFLDHGPKAVAELEANTEVKFRARSLHPDYRTELDGSTLRGRVLEAVPFDGRKLGSLLSVIREPIPEFTVLGGMMVNQEDVSHLVKMNRSWLSFKYGMNIILRHACDRLAHRRGTRLMMGNALTGRLLYSLDQRKMRPSCLGAEVTRIDADGGRVSTVSIEQRGHQRRIAAKRGLVMATGWLQPSRKIARQIAAKASRRLLPRRPRTYRPTA